MGIPAPPNLRPPAQDEDQEGFVQDIVQGLRSIPHLPAALINGVDEPGISPDESKLRHRAMAEASQWVLPMLISGGTLATLPGGGVGGPLVAAVVDALGWGAGAAGHAYFMGKDPGQIAMEGAMGAGLGAVAGGVGHAIKGAGEAVEKAALEKAATMEANKTAASEGAKNVAQALLPTRSFPESRSAGFVAGEASGLPTFVNKVAETAAGDAPEQMVQRAETGTLTPGVPLTFKEGEKNIPGFSPKTVVADDAVALSLHGIDSYGAASNTANATGVLDTFAPDQIIRGTFKEIGDSILKRDFGTTLKALQRAGQNITLTDTWRQMIEAGSRALEPARKTLQRMGAAGVELADKLDQSYLGFKDRFGKDAVELQDIFSGMEEKQRIKIGEIVEGLATPADDAEKMAADRFRALMDKYADDATELGIREHSNDGDVKDFTRRTNYMTHYYSEAAIKKYLKEGSPEFEKAHKLLTEISASRSKAETKRALNAWIKTPSEFRTGPLNNVRENFDIPYEKDPLKVGMKYTYQVGKRLELAKVFGANDKVMKAAIIERIAMDGGNPTVASRIYDAYAGTLPQEYPALVKALHTINIWTMLSTSGLVQPAQLLNTAAKTGYLPLLKAIGTFWRDPKTSDYLATKAGVHINEVLQDVLGEGFMENPNSFFLKNIIGLEPLDKVNRIISATAGRFQLDVLAEKLANAKTPGQIAKLTTKLKGLDVDAAELVANNHVPTEAMYDRAAYRASVDTQHATTTLDQPELKTTAQGKILLHFRGFALQQAGFINREIMKPAKAYLTSGGQRGSLGPLARYAAGIGPVGYVIGNLVRGFKGRVAPDDPALAMLENAAYAGGFGIYYDMIDAMVSGKDRVLSLLAGPSVGEAAAYLGDVGATFKGNPEQLAKHLVKRVPVIGQPLANYWFWPQTK